MLIKNLKKRWLNKRCKNFQDKVQVGREKYQDFDKVTGDVDYARFPNVVRLLGDLIDNSGDVAYELGKDRGKLALLEYAVKNHHVTPS